MIIISIFEGLGNQMFQYATARRLAEKHSTVLKLDITPFEFNKRRKYGLHCFNIQENIATRYEVDKLTKPPKNRFKNLFNKFPRYSYNNKQENASLLKEKFFHFDPSILEAGKNIYLNGYWQSEKYFLDIRDILLSEFSFKYPQLTENKELSEKIRLSDSISLHIRRGDYVCDKDVNQFHGNCSLVYYERCIEYVCKRVKKPQFFIFSDDPCWVRAHLKLDFPFTIVENNRGFRSYEDLRLMSECKHNIIANSSFSWWGAWLNSNPDKIVCAPQQWFNVKLTDTKYSLPENYIKIYTDSYVDTKDLIPENWVKL